MGKADIEAKQYMQDNAHFADALNYILYNGRQVIDPADLKDLDTTEIAIPYGNDARVPKQAFRDVIKQWRVAFDGKAIYVLLAGEDQTSVHYAMPVKNAVYDALNYARQVEESKKSYRGRKAATETTLSSGEYLSGFRKTDRLIPIITIVIYFGADSWDGPMSLHEMLAPTDAELLRFIPDYRINLISPAGIPQGDFEKFTTEFGKVMEYVKYSRDKEKLKLILSENDRYSSVDRDTFELINVLTNSTLKAIEKEGKIDMCQAIADMKAEAIQQGMQQGMQQNAIANIKTLMENMSWTAQQAMDALSVSAEERAKYAEML